MEIKEKNILVPMDFRPQAEGAFNEAIGIAKQMKRQIVLLYVHQEKGALTSIFSKKQNELFDEAVNEKLSALAMEQSQKYGVEIVTKLVHNNSVHAAIVDTASKLKSDLIVMGRGGVNVIGSNTSRVLRCSRVPVITITGKNDVPEKYRSILLPLDLTKETRQKVNWGIILAKLFGAKIKVISALWDKNNENIVNQLKAQLVQVESFIKKQGLECSVELVTASEKAKTLVPIILNYAREQGDIDMILIMTQQETGFSEFFMGSHATELIRKSEVPVMSIIPHETGQIIWGI